MQTTFLLPQKLKKIGWWLFSLTLPLGIYILYNNGRIEFDFLNATVYTFFPTSFFSNNSHFIPVNLTNTIVGVLFILGSLMVGFSKEKVEDEYIASIRTNALVWAVFVNYSLLIVAFILFYSDDFLSVMIYNMFTVLLLFIIRFHYLLLKNKGN